ncbi:hypothetical protein PRN20_18310 [Devosia sp. ZB163]|uniref:hypothetical protein n=1 Tax=Devosia sp. ZB163 TaxID=3025938 RepID=UPI002361E8D4|nr:hypothetical protein [Devosia sp. ZB163]MDC9825692.1 hypothetical protein [Devosia sp. ZB163]
MTTTIERAAAWIAGRDTGASSKALWATMMGVPSDKSHPHDGDDLGRCIRLLEAVPEWKARIGEMAAVSAYWAALVPHWDELVELHNRSGREVYVRMRQLLDPVEAADPKVFRMGKGVTVSFGR